MTSNERVTALHERMDALRRVQERRKTRAIGAASVVVTLCLILLVSSGGMHLSGAAGLYSGATMLFEGAGAYVLIAVIAFMAGVIVAVVLLRGRAKREEASLKQNPEKEDREVSK